MKNVKRLPIPDTLKKNSVKWTDDLITAIKNNQKTGKEIPDKVKNRYHK